MDNVAGHFYLFFNLTLLVPIDLLIISHGYVNPFVRVSQGLMYYCL